MRIIADSNIPFVAECFSSIGEVEVVAARQITVDVVRDADILLVRSVTRVGADLLAESNVRFVGSATIGTDHIDIEYLERHNIGFASAPGSNANSVAEYVVAALLEIGRKHSINLEGKSIGIIGVGNVGSKVEKKVAALGMKVYLNDPPLKRQTGDAKYLPIEELYDCDFVTLHTPLTFEGIDKTYHLANERFFKALKKGCIFLNTARGAVVDSEALKEAIRIGKLKAAVLDVWENEPNIDAELLEMVDIGTAHIAGYSLDGKVAGMIMIYKVVCDYLGIEAKFDFGSLLPEPKVPRINIDSEIDDEQEVIRKTVEKIYNIKEDDVGLRGILNVSVEKRGEYFSELRNNYPVHREFHNTEVIITKEGTENLSKKLKGIGFKIANL